MKTLTTTIFLIISPIAINSSLADADDWSYQVFRELEIHHLQRERVIQNIKIQTEVLVYLIRVLKAIAVFENTESGQPYLPALTELDELIAGMPREARLDFEAFKEAYDKEHGLGE